jgi:hypothetical protein
MLTLYFLIKNKIDCCSVMENVGLRVPTKQLRDFSTFNVSSVSRLSPSPRCVTAANICKSLDVFNKHNISFADTLYLILPSYVIIVLVALFYCLGSSFRLVSVLALVLIFVIYIFSARLLYATRYWQALKLTN